MATLILDLENDIDVEQFVSKISSMSEIKNIVLKNDITKSQTQILLDKMDNGEYVSDDEYLRSIPGFMEKLDEESNDPNAQWIPIEEVWPEWRNA